MRTRTLLLLAIGCGLAILLAGGIQLLRVSGQQQNARLLNVGEAAKLGDVSVALISSSVHPAEVLAIVRIGGVDDPHGLDGFTLVGPGKVMPVTSSTCHSIAMVPADCQLTFATSGIQGTSRQLIFRRADEQLRWVLAQGN